MENLKNTLSRINALGLRTKKDLIASASLYEKLCYDIDEFITGTVFRSHSNITKLSNLKELGVDIEDVRMDCLERCISKLNLVLAYDLAGQIPYLYTIANHIIIDTYRKNMKTVSSTISLNVFLDNRDTKNDSEKARTIEDCTQDKKANTELNYLVKEQVLEIINKYANNAESLLCALASKVMQDKPAELAQILIAIGSVEKALLLYITNIQEQFDISTSELPKVAAVKHMGLSKLLSTEEVSAKVVSTKISNILNRTR